MDHHRPARRAIAEILDLSTWIGAIVGCSFILLLLYRVVADSRHSHRHA